MELIIVMLVQILCTYIISKKIDGSYERSAQDMQAIFEEIRSHHQNWVSNTKWFAKKLNIQ